MPNQRLDQAKPFLVLGILFLAWLILPTIFKRTLRVSFFEFHAPVETAASSIRDVQTFWDLRSRSKVELIQAGKELAQLNASYEKNIQDLAALQGEIARLEDLLRLPSFPEYRSETARVVRRDFTAWWQRITIRKGSNFGITVGSPVIFIGGLVGRVTEVGAYTSVVELISSPGVRIAASIENEKRPISYQGGINTALGIPYGLVEYVPLDIHASEQKQLRLFSSGLGGVYPPNLLIGMLTKVEPSTDGLFKPGTVQLDSRLGFISEVTVLVPIKAP